jgi:S1-C subfamily serine protease
MWGAGAMAEDLIELMSEAFADRVAAAASCVVALGVGHWQRSGILWGPDLVVTSEQLLGERTQFSVAHAGAPGHQGGSPGGANGGESGATGMARLIGRDPGTNVSLLRLDTPLDGARPEAAPIPRLGSLALVMGADATGVPTSRLAMLHAVGPEWHSQAGGRIDALLRLDVRLGAEEGGPVLSPGGKLIGMSTAGPPRRTLVIPTATIERVLPALLADGHVARGWLGVGLQSVAVPDGLRTAAGYKSGMMVVSLADGAPAAQAGVLLGDIVLDVEGTPARRPRLLAAALGPERIGQPVSLRLLRAGTLHTLSVLITARPAR